MDTESASSLDLLLSDAFTLRPSLATALPNDLAASAPKPDRPPRGVDAASLDAPEADPNDLPRQRWAVIAPLGASGDETLAAIAPLLRLRAAEQGAEPKVYRVPPNMNLGEAARWKNEVLRAEHVPEVERSRYLLILGDLHEVSADLQHVLANGAFVGRIHFAKPDGTPALDRYEAYAKKVVRWEREPTDAGNPDALFFVATDGTSATRTGARMLVDPCIQMARRTDVGRPFPAERIESIPPCAIGSDFLHAARLAKPSVLLSVSHGLGRPRGGFRSVAEQRALQGALLVGSNPGLDSVLAAEQLAQGPFLPGGLWFCVACFAAGTPARSAFYPWLTALAREGLYAENVARVLESLPREDERPFIAALPQAALANPEGPLAMIAHLDLAWTFSFVDAESGARSRASRIFSALQGMARGARVGVAYDALMRAYREVNDEVLADYQTEEDARVWNLAYRVDAMKRGDAHMLRNDLRGYVLLGDPAARLPLRVKGSTAEVREQQPANAGVPSVLESSDTSDAGAEMEKAVLDVLRGDEGARAIAARYKVTRDRLDEWVEVYKKAGRAALVGRFRSG